MIGMQTRWVAWMICLCALSGVVRATVTFDLFGNETLYGILDDQEGPLSYTNGGIVATFMASDGTMNRTKDYFGINSNIEGDDTAGFDVGEWIDITFDQTVILN